MEFYDHEKVRKLADIHDCIMHITRTFITFRGTRLFDLLLKFFGRFFVYHDAFRQNNVNKFGRKKIIRDAT